MDKKIIGYCPECGDPLYAGASFCKKCGTPVPKRLLDAAGAQSGQQQRTAQQEKTSWQAQQAAQPQRTAQAPASPKQDRSGKTIIIILACVLAVAVAVIVLFVLGILPPSKSDGTPEGKETESAEEVPADESQKDEKEKKEKGDSFDPFDSLAVAFVGADQAGQVSLSYGGDEFSSADFSCTPDSGLSNGDTVTVALSADAADRYEEEHDGEKPAPTKKDYTVSGLSAAGAAPQTAAAAAGDFVLPESSTRLLTDADLYGLTAEECKIARNEIYARHGRRFKDAALQAYFDSKSWYTGTIEPDDFPENMLSDIEMKNRDMIVNYEKEMGYR